LFNPEPAATEGEIVPLARIIHWVFVWRFADVERL
jgi:hypothetical protein